MATSQQKVDSELQPSAWPIPLFMKATLCGALFSIASGFFIGWLRYWTGFFVLAQGAGCGLLLGWLVSRVLKTKAASFPAPDSSSRLKLAFLWFAGFQVGLILGFGFGQARFDPFGFLSLVLIGKSAEFTFGIMSSGGANKGFAMGANGLIWVLFSLVDWAIMFFFLAIMPWGGGKSEKESNAEESTKAQNEATPKPKPWMHVAGIALAGFIGLGILVDFYDIRPALELKVAKAATRAGDYHTALRLARRVTFFSNDGSASHAQAMILAGQAAWKLGISDLALGYLNDLLTKNPDQGPALLLKGEILLNQSRPEPALSALDRYFAEDQAARKVSISELSHAYTRMQAEKRKPGYDILKRRVGEAEQNLARALALRGEACLDIGRLVHARENLEASLALDITRPESHYLLCRTLEKLGSFAEAHKECRAALWFAKRLEKWEFEADLYHKQDWIERTIVLEKKAQTK